ncbi:MAG: hypothetical protein KJO75_19085 [Dactylosporangium sp.]|nr:hypothetical protein [Dactylosporangium sp.]
MKRILLALVVAFAVLAAGVTTAHAMQGRPAPAHTTSTATTPTAALSLTPYDPANYTDLYTDPTGPITGSTYIFNPTADFQTRLAFDFAHMRDVGVNTVGFYNLVQMTDADRDILFTELERNRQQAVVRIEWYDGATFDFDNDDPTHADAEAVLRYYDSDDPTHGYTALLSYLVRRDRLADIAYFAVNMPVDDGTVASHFVTEEYQDGRTNPKWAASQAPYADHLLAGLRARLGQPAQCYLSVFYGWDQSYPTPSYAGIEHPADGYFLNNYSYPIAAPPDETVSTSDRLNQPRLQRAMDRLVAQYPTQPKVVEYGLHTVEFNNGVVPNQTAGLMQTIAAKKLALTETTAFYANGSSDGTGFNVRGTLYFAQNLYKEEGNPPAVMDWTLDYPATSAVEAEDSAVTRIYQDGVVVPSRPLVDRDASGGRAVALRRAGASLAVHNLAAASAVQIRYRADRDTTVELSVNGAAPRAVSLPATRRAWRTVTASLDVPLQGAVSVRRTDGRGTVAIDWLRPLPHHEAELATGQGTVVVHPDAASDGGALTLPADSASSVTFATVRAGSQVQVRYAAASPATLTVRIGGAGHTLDLPATGGSDTFADATTALTVPGDGPVTLVRAAASGEVVLDYLRVDGMYEAESSGGLYNGAHGVANPRASGGALATSIDVVGASVVFTGIMGGTLLTFRYASTRDASMTVILNGRTHRIAFPGTGGALAQAMLPVEIPANTTVIVQRNADNAAVGLDIDSLTVSG